MITRLGVCSRVGVPYANTATLFRTKVLSTMDRILLHI